MKTWLGLNSVLLLIALFSIGPWANAQAKKVSEECRPWMQKIDPTLGKDSATQLPAPDQDLLVAVRCLLEAEGNKGPSQCNMNMSHNGGTDLPPPTVEIYALYYISYIFEGDWEYAVGIALEDRQGRINPPGSAHAAYVAYQKWFVRVKKMGVAQARREHLKPLDRHGDIDWFGGTAMY
jgi:hypothetical protein